MVCGAAQGDYNYNYVSVTIFHKFQDISVKSNETKFK